MPMKQFPFLLLVAGSLFLSPAAVAQQPVNDDLLQPDEFTEILKQEWVYLKEQTDAFLAETAVKDEFETTVEYETRVAQRRQTYSANVMKRIKDQKLDTRQFGVLLKARLVGYNADRGTYAVACSTAVIAPYDTPSLVSFVPSNPYVVLTDTVVGGYRTSRMSLSFKPTLTWTVDRSIAREAKGDEGALFFKVRTTIDIAQPNIKNQAHLRIVPREILLFNNAKNKIYWREEIR